MSRVSEWTLAALSWAATFAEHAPTDLELRAAYARWQLDGDDQAFVNSLEEYWKRGEGAGKIRWGTPGDWTRCHGHLTKHVGSERAKRICAQWHHDVTGMWPGDKRNQ